MFLTKILEIFFKTLEIPNLGFGCAFCLEKYEKAFSIKFKI